jgi:aspartyl-tRNA(Asn)/glutamyl-tRNA(Gln) amidotransferase subunit A
VQARVSAQLARIDRLDRHLRAFALVTPELALEAAWAVDRAGATGFLTGKTLAVKDLFDMRGLPTGAGARTPVVGEAGRDAAAVARLRAAGMVPVGKTAMVELAFGTWGINRAVGTPRNPWDAGVERVPGGSSSGSAVAVAAGLADMALGSDTGGSIRIPCALNGLTGLRPSFGRVSRAGTAPLAPSADSMGPMARTVGEVAAMMAALAGPDGDDPATAAAAPFDAEAMHRASMLKGARLAVLGDADLAPVQSAVGDAYLTAIATLERLGAKLVEVSPPVTPYACVEPAGLFLAGEAWRCWEERYHRLGGEMDPGTRTRLEGGSRIGPGEMARLVAARAGDQGRHRAWAQDFTAILTPTVPITAPAFAAADESTLPFSTYSRIANWLDLPALALPGGFDGVGLPLSIQVLGMTGADEQVLGIGQAWQGATDWHERRPDLSAFGA